MAMKSEESRQLDAEILLLVKKEGSITGYGIVKSLEAPPMTIRYKLKRLVEKGKLDCHEDSNAKVYSIPKPGTKKPKPKEKKPAIPKPMGRPRLGKLPSEIASLKEAEKRQG
mgnify:CR=1 FL=1